MKNILKKYYEMDNEVKNDLPLLYIYHEFLNSLNNYEEIKLEKVEEQEKLMQIILKCLKNTDLSVHDVITNTLNTLTCKDITIQDLEKLEMDELLEILFYDIDTDDDITDENEKQEIISEFMCRGYYCIFCKINNKYLLILIKDTDTDVLIFNSIEDILSDSIQQHLLNKKLYG